MHARTASLKLVGVTCVLFKCVGCWAVGCDPSSGFSYWGSKEERGISRSTLPPLKLQEKFQGGIFVFVGQTLIPVGWMGSCGLATSAAWQCDGTSPLQLAHRNMSPHLSLLRGCWCVLSPCPDVTLCTGRLLLLLSVDAAGRGEASAENALWIKTCLVPSPSDLLVLAQAPCHRKERERSSDRM